MNDIVGYSFIAFFVSSIILIVAFIFMGFMGQHEPNPVVVAGGIGFCGGVAGMCVGLIIGDDDV